MSIQDSVVRRAAAESGTFAAKVPAPRETLDRVCHNRHHILIFGWPLAIQSSFDFFNIIQMSSPLVVEFPGSANPFIVPIPIPRSRTNADSLQNEVSATDNMLPSSCIMLYLQG
jgi:hypothetical protein